MATYVPCTYPNCTRRTYKKELGLCGFHTDEHRSKETTRKYQKRYEGDKVAPQLCATPNCTTKTTKIHCHRHSPNYNTAHKCQLCNARTRRLFCKDHTPQIIIQAPQQAEVINKEISEDFLMDWIMELINQDLADKMISSH